MPTSQRTRPGARDVQNCHPMTGTGHRGHLWNYPLRAFRFAGWGVAVALLIGVGLQANAQQPSRYEASRIPVTRPAERVYHAVAPGPQSSRVRQVR
ncbi:MAG: hypothetical protein ACF8TS_06735, partial [Maioricimonas sp. JB049]